MITVAGAAGALTNHSAANNVVTHSLGGRRVASMSPLHLQTLESRLTCCDRRIMLEGGGSRGPIRSCPLQLA